jgi:hypothetical protein
MPDSPLTASGIHGRLHRGTATRSLMTCKRDTQLGIRRGTLQQVVGTLILAVFHQLARTADVLLRELQMQLRSWHLLRTELTRSTQR